MIKFKHSGNFSKTENFLNRNRENIYIDILNRYGAQGVSILSSATPKDTGETASSWSYKVTSKNGISKLTFLNSSEESGVPIVILIQYGHATFNGGWVEGRDFINPSVKPLFDAIVQNVWREVTNK